MNAVRKTAPGPGQVEVCDVEEPACGSDQVIVEVAAAGICGTDVHIVDDEFATRPPVTLGHELAGTVAEVGGDVHGWRVGDRVTSETYFFTCGQCIQCRRGRPNLCKERRSIGSKADGAFARFIALPARNLHRVPDDLTLEEAALTEPLACTVHGVNDTAGIRAGDDVVIAGPGPIGLLAAQVALANGARVVVLGTSADEARLALAQALGVHAAIDVQHVDDPSQAVRELLHAEGADVVVECSGAEAAVPTLLEVVAPGGRYAQMGLFGKPIRLRQDAVCYKELVVTGTNATVPTAWPRALRLLASRHVDVAPLITHRFPVEAWDHALATVRRQEGAKVLLQPSA